MEDDSNPLYCSHDKLFKETWSNIENARSLLENYLPHDLLEKVDMDSLEICKDSFVEKSLKEFHSDLLYKVKMADNNVYIYYLFEHKSYPDSLIHLQLLKYMLGIWQLNLKQTKSKTLDIIVPLVMYHGAKNWTTPVDFAGIFNDRSETIQPFIPDFNFILYDLTKYSDEEIKGNVLSRVVMLVLKYIFTSEIEQQLPVILNLFSDLIKKETGLQYIESLLRYLLSNMENMTGDKLKKIVADSITGKEGGVIMELTDSALGKMYKKGMDQGLEQGMQQGMQQGLQQGALKELKEAVFDLIDVKFGNNKESDYLKVLIKPINDIDQLKQLKNRIKTTSSISDVQAFIGN